MDCAARDACPAAPVVRGLCGVVCSGKRRKAVSALRRRSHSRRKRSTVNAHRGAKSSHTSRS
eukprot:4858837-Prymnesium_polylepis.1